MKMAELTDEKAQEILEEARDRFQTAEIFYSDLYELAKEDWAFTHGEGHWKEETLSARNKDGRPSLVLNQCLPYVHQITNDIKQARIAIRVTPIDDKADIDTAEIRAGIIRNIEKQSKAKDVYGTAASNAIGAGIGWIQVNVEYADETSFEQEIFIKRILDFTSVFLDPTSEEKDGSDAEYGFKLLTYSKDKFEELYPDASAISFEGKHTSKEEEEINLVEYYYKDREVKTLVEIYSQGMTTQLYEDELKDLDFPYEKLRSREVELTKVYHCILSGEEVLEREEFPCKFIPLIPVIGEEYFSDGKRRFRSLIHPAKDAQRMYDYWKSASVEMVALQPKTPWIAPVGSFDSFAQKWENANTENYPFLEYDVVIEPETGQPLPPPTRANPIQGSPILVQEAETARADIRYALGIPQSNMGERSTAVSGIAIRNQQIEGDNASFHFIDNLTSSIAQVGRIINNLIPYVYSDRTIARILGEEGEPENVPINTPFAKIDGQYKTNNLTEPDGIYDMSVGKYDIEMDVGASYSSKRQEMADKMIEVAQIRPEIMDIAGDLFFASLDMPMSREISERIKSQMPPEVLGDDPQAAALQKASQQLQQMQEQLLNYEAALADKEKDKQFEQTTKMTELELEKEKLAIQMETARADIAKTYSEIEKNNAETMAQRQESLDNISRLAERTEDIGSAVEQILEHFEREMSEQEEGEPEKEPDKSMEDEQWKT